MCLLSTAPAVIAANFDWQSPFGEVNFFWENRLTAGVQVRTEERDPALIDKTNVPGQRQLCAALPGQGVAAFFNPDCQSRVGDPTPIRRLVNAQGGYNVNGDDGNLAYDQGDATYAPLLLRSELSMNWNMFSAKISGIGYRDVANNDYDTGKQDLRYPNRGLSRDTITIERRDELDERFWQDDLRFLAAWVAADFNLFDTPINVKVGSQRLRWGESNLFNFQVLDRVNPLSERLFVLPGVQVRDAFLPVDMVNVSADLTTNFAVQAFYQYDWDRTEPAPSGSFLSFNDAAANGDGPTPVYLSAGQYPEDPFGQFVPGGGDVLLDQSNRTTFLDDRNRGVPKDGGQYGLRLNYFAENLNGGTEISLYGMNIHSRLPYLSVDAAQESCLGTDVQGGDLVNNLDPCAQQNPDSPLTNTFPVNSVKPFLDYPEDIQIYGLSFTTNAGKWSLAGELSYSPNQPAQVAFADVLYAGLQPAFPNPDDAPQQGDLIDGENAILLPTADVAVPDYLSDFRGNTVTAGETIRGYERLEVGQIDLTGVRVFNASNPIGANRIIFLAEVAAQHIPDLPSLDELQFEGNTANVGLHYTPGGASFDDQPFTQGGDDGVGPSDPGASECPDPNAGCRPVGPTDRINPERADADNFADDFSFGYRLRATATYNDALFGLTTTPGFEFFHDVYGTSITPGQNFVEGRKRLTLSNKLQFSNALTGNLAYRFYWGAGYRNVRLDRDYVEASLTYNF